MPAGRLLLVAPETDLRHSLVFALETDGFSVTLRDAPPTLSWLAQNHFDCTIVDQKAFTGAVHENIAFCVKAHPVVLLAAQPHTGLLPWVAQAIDLPLDGSDVTSAVRHALHLDA
jgi:hypothetical protein